MRKRFGNDRLAIMKRKKKKDPAAVALGRRGGRASAKARMKKLTPEQRTEYARNAANARWSSKKGPTGQ